MPRTSKKTSQNPNPGIAPLQSLDPGRFETRVLLKQLAAASRALAELKGVIASIPREDMLINTLGLSEAKDSSEIENIITTEDDLYKDDAFPESQINPAAKEVLRYRQALQVGYASVQKRGLITINQIVELQAELELNNAGVRKLPGTVLKDGSGRTVYTPLQEPDEILGALKDLEVFMNDETIFDADPLIKMALIHYQFESIHPFYDGNGRTGRILNVLYLVKEGLLKIPVLYLSRHIVRTKPEYYRLLQAVREEDAWDEWVRYMLTAVERSATDAVNVVHAIREAMLDVKHRIRAGFKFYSQDLINSLFNHPYTKIGFLERDLEINRDTAARYLDELAAAGILEKRKHGRANYYINTALFAILSGSYERGR